MPLPEIQEVGSILHNIPACPREKADRMKFIDIIKHIVRNFIQYDVVHLSRNTQMDYVRIVSRRPMKQK